MPLNQCRTHPPFTVCGSNYRCLRAVWAQPCSHWWQAAKLEPVGPAVGSCPLASHALVFPSPITPCVPQIKVTSWHGASLKTTEWGMSAGLTRQFRPFISHHHGALVRWLPAWASWACAFSEGAALRTREHVCTTQGYLQFPLYPSAAGAGLELAKQKLNQLSGEIKIWC